MTDVVQQARLREQLRTLAEFLPAFETPSSHSENLERSFISKAYEAGWVLKAFDWGAWKDTAEARLLRDTEGALASATPDDLARLLTTLIRQQRFTDGGSLTEEPERGLIIRILRRATVLANDNSE